MNGRALKMGGGRGAGRWLGLLVAGLAGALLLSALAASPANASLRQTAHQEHADNLYKLAHPENPKRQKNLRRTLRHVVLPIGLIVVTASIAVGAEVVSRNSTRSAPAVPANSVCRVYNSIDGGLAAQDSRIKITFAISGGAYITSFSGLPLSYLYAFTDGSFFNLTNLQNNQINSGGVSIDYIKACAVNPGPAMPPFNSRNALVDQQYRDFLGRKATTAELSCWAEATKNMTANAGATSILSWFVQNESAQRGPLVRLYRAYYLRWPDPSGYSYWVGKLRSGTPLAKVSNSFASANEFKTRYGILNNADFANVTGERVFD